MGKASSSKKVARAARAAGRPGVKKSYAWPATIGAVVILGMIGVVFSFQGDSKDTSAPRVGDHWHAAYGVYHCDTFLPYFPQEAQDLLGIHTHGEGLMHIHPFASSVTGKKANIAAFAEDVQLKVTDTSIKADSIGLDVKNGDKCGTKAGHVELVTWTPGATGSTIVKKDIATYAPPDQSVWVLAFVADGTTVPQPDSVANLTDPTAAEEGRQPATGAVTSLPTGATTTTVPASDSTTTTAKP